MNRVRTLIVVGLAVALAACGARQAPDGEPRTPRRQDLLTQEEIRTVHYNNLYDVVATLRPSWLRTRGQISFENPAAGRVVVYMNGVRAGGAEFLRQIVPRDVTSLEYYSEVQAGARFGLQQNAGPAIVINTGPGG